MYVQQYYYVPRYAFASVNVLDTRYATCNTLLIHKSAYSEKHIDAGSYREISKKFCYSNSILDAPISCS